MFTLYNTLSRKKEVFEPIAPPRVGLYVCGPTVYGPPHPGHARSAITFDILFRYLTYLGYKVRYVRNITDVGHLEHDADDGEDKIAKLARLEKLEPMEVAHFYTEKYHEAMRRLNVLSPSIEPHASGHIIEQIEMIKQIFDAGYAYEANGSVYFDVEKYASAHNYGELSGRNVEDMLSGTRVLDGGSDKKSPLDFALWKKASPEHIMRWSSPWSDGFPGWHLECSAMSVKYLGEKFDIHGGGMDLMFPHHEAEIAQCTAAGDHGARYWVHNNMVTTGGQKMGKSLGNAVSLDDFDGMTVRFLMLQAHYRSTVDFSHEALGAAEKGLERLMKAMETLAHLEPSGASTVDVGGLEKRFTEAMDDDLNTPIVISHLFDAVRTINQLHDGSAKISSEDLAQLKMLMSVIVFDVLGLRDDRVSGENILAPVMDMVMELRAEAKASKNWELSDRIRDGLAAAGIKIMDKKEGGSEWQLQ